MPIASERHAMSLSAGSSTPPTVDPDRHMAPAAQGDVPVPDTEIGRLFRDTDWSRTPLGPVEGWPLALRVAVGICLNSRFPMFVWWGASLVNIYNDAYIPVLGQRHPRAFAQPAREWWHEIWPVLGPQVDDVMLRGKPTWNDRVLLVMERKGYTEPTYFTWSYSPIYDEHGRIGGLFCACIEETPRVEAERERDELIRRAQDTLQTLQTWFDNAPGFVALLRGPDFVFEMMNQSYYQLVGDRPIQGRPAFEALPDLRHQGFEELLRRVYETGEPFVGRGVRVMVQKEEGVPPTEAFIDLVYQPVRDADGHVTGIFAQGHDVTEQVHAVQAIRDADRRKDQFLATLAHELRNPLAPVLQAAGIARTRGIGEEKLAWALGVIERQARHMGLLLDDLLDVSRISLGRLDLRMRRVAVREVVDAAVETVLPLVDERQHRLTIAVTPPDLAVRADPLRLAQVVSNLLSNAAKYTDVGGRIEVLAAEEGADVVVRVRDNGIGLAESSKAEVFEMFSQVSMQHHDNGGLGIGLALSRGLVELHGGRITVHSAGLRQGCEFDVHLPRHDAAPADEPSPASSAETGSHGRRVLIADDNADALDSMALLLQLEGHDVHTARTGGQALEQAAQLRPDVAVLDIGMPGMNGYEVASRIRAEPWGRDVVLIAVTGWGQSEDRARARDAGFDHHCTKPVDTTTLQSMFSRRD
jgi:signal transduction histidine kinase